LAGATPKRQLLLSYGCAPVTLKRHPHHGSRGVPGPIPILPCPSDQKGSNGRRRGIRHAGASAKKHEARAVPFVLTTRSSC
ncbi:hypothetical protein TGAM01_v207758, partial [Trichoderma gamsii]